MGHALPSTVEEQDILASCRDGTEDAFEMLYRRYAAPLREFCRGRLGDPSEAEDACHETLLKASTAVDRFDDARPLWPWLATIAANVCLGLQRAQSRDVIGIGKGIEARIEPARDPHAEVTSRMCTQLVGEAIRDLPDRYRARVYLRELEGWTYRQIADLEHTTVPAIRSSLARGRKALETRLRLAAESNPLWPLPAFVPFRWMRRVLPGSDPAARARVLADTGVLAPAAVPNLVGVVAALFVAAALVTPAFSGLLGASPSDTHGLHTPGVTAADLVSTTAASGEGGAAGARDDVTGPAGEQPGATTRTALDADIEPPGSAGVRTHLGADVKEDEGGRRLGRSVTFSVPGQPDRTIEGGSLFDCETSKPREAVCDAFDGAADFVLGEPDDD